MPSDAFENVLNRLQSESNAAHAARVALAKKNQWGADAQKTVRHELECRVAREFLVRKEVDDACRFWIKNGTWPMPKQHDTVLDYWDRLFEAMMLAGWLKTNGFSSEKTETELLELFLIESWEAIGLRRLQARLQQHPG